jgi:hypothetical protein
MTLLTPVLISCYNWQALPLLHRCTLLPALPFNRARAGASHSSVMAMARGSAERPGNDSEKHAIRIVNIADLVTKPVGHHRIDVPQFTHELGIDKRHIATGAAGGLDCGLMVLFGERLRNAEKLGYWH